MSLKSIKSAVGRSVFTIMTLDILPLDIPKYVKKLVF